jgi:anaerobic sulfite reductase subunit C
MKPRVAAEVIESETYHLQPCRGLRGVCPFALAKDPLLVEQIDLAVRTSAWWPRVRPGMPHHLRLRVALAACPNACTMPQIRDIGIIATVTPRAVGSQCNGCGVCERTCREGAIVVQDGRAVLNESLCVGCGQCIQRCPRHVIDGSPIAIDRDWEPDPGPLRLRILVGGRMGRHPRWAQDLCEVDVASAAAVVKAFLDVLARQASPTEPVAEAVERITIERLRQEIGAAIRAAECVPSCRPAYPLSVGGKGCSQRGSKRR